MVVVVDAGRIVEQGPHADLVAADGLYARLYESWLGNTRSAALGGEAAGTALR